MELKFDCGPQCGEWPMEEKTPCNPTLQQKTECVSFFECSVCLTDTITPISGTAFDTIKTYLRDLKMCKGCKTKVCGTCYEAMSLSTNACVPSQCPVCKRPDAWMSQPEKKTFLQGKVDGLANQAVTEVFEALLADAVYDSPSWRDWALPTLIDWSPSVVAAALGYMPIVFFDEPADGAATLNTYFAVLMNWYLLQRYRELERLRRLNN
jgi:hypothetical protein